VQLTVTRSSGVGEVSLNIDLGPLVDAIVERLEPVIARQLAAQHRDVQHADAALDVPAAAARLGISRAAAWRLVRAGELGSVKVGARRRVVPSSAIAAFLGQKTPPPEGH
jgi:excisionase family DNA binding protein